MVIRQKGESHNGCFKKTKHLKFSEKRTFLTPWYNPRFEIRPFALLPTNFGRKKFSWSLPTNRVLLPQVYEPTIMRLATFPHKVLTDYWYSFYDPRKGHHVIMDAVPLDWESSAVTNTAQKWNFPLRSSSVNVTKFAFFCGFGRI